MKKALSALLVLMISCCFYLTGCNVPPEEQETVKYSDTYTYNDTFHWRKQIGGSGVTEYEEHVNAMGKSVVCILSVTT